LIVASEVGPAFRIPNSEFRILSFTQALP
jgi:hypothetical protein